MEGLILKAYIENQRRPKTQIAKELKMSKQNLYQLFDSKKLEDETIKNIESVFKVKWSQIKASVNIDGNIATKGIKANGAPENSLKPDFYKLEATLAVLFDVVVAMLSTTSGESETLVRRRLDKRVDELRRFSGG